MFITIATIKIGDAVCVYKDKAPRQLWSMGAVKSLITGRDGYHRGAVVTVCSEDRVVEMARLLNRLYPAEVESQVREERQNRNTNFPITLSSWEMPNRSMLVNIMINLKNSDLFCFHLLFYSFRC